MATTAKVRTLNVRPIQSADLSFEVPGILSSQHASKAQLGSRVRGFDLSGLNAVLATPANGQPASFMYGPTAIQNYIDTNFDLLFTLKNDLLRTSLSQAITQREITYLERYQHIAEIANSVKRVYADTASGKLKRLEDLQRLMGGLKDALDQAYRDTQYDRVVTDTVTSSDNVGRIVSDVFLTPVAMKNERQVTHVAGSGDHVTEEHKVIPQAWRSGSWNDLGELPDPIFKSQRTETNNDLKQVSRTRNPNFNYPSVENKIQEHRVQLSIQDETLLHEAISYKVPNLEEIMRRELSVIDHEIAKAQHKYIQTFLFSPISGQVTAVYKDVGESVQVGEPVIRVENDDELLIVGLIQHKGLIRVGQIATITTSNAFESPSAFSISGTVVSVRGHDSDDDEWDVIIRCGNTSKGVPLNYSFDRETTRVDLS